MRTRLAFIEGEWRRYRDSAAWHDTHEYADIIEGIRRQGFLDALGDDFWPSNYDNGDYPIVIGERLDEGGRPEVIRISAHRLRSLKGTRRERYAKAAAEAQEQWEAAQRERQRQRERIADQYWRQEQKLREYKARWVERVVVPQHPEEQPWAEGLRVELECHQLIHRAYLVFTGELPA